MRKHLKCSYLDIFLSQGGFEKGGRKNQTVNLNKGPNYTSKMIANSLSTYCTLDLPVIIRD